MSPVTEYSAPLDRIDREILRILTEDARIPWSTLGERVHLSANAVADRVRRLRQRGVIRKFSIDLDQRALGRNLEAVVDVIVDDHGWSFADRVAERDEITWLGYVTGRFDFILHVSCAGTEHLDEFLVFLKRNGARETNTTVVLRRAR